jgi:hypothetical protein
MTIWDPAQEKKRSNITVDELLHALSFFLRTNSVLDSCEFILEAPDKDFGTTDITIVSDTFAGHAVDRAYDRIWFDIPKCVRSTNARLGSQAIAVRIRKRTNEVLGGNRKTVEITPAPKPPEELLVLVAEPLDKKRIAIHFSSSNPDGTVNYVPTKI